MKLLLNKNTKQKNKKIFIIKIIIKFFLLIISYIQIIDNKDINKLGINGPKTNPGIIREKVKDKNFSL